MTCICLFIGCEECNNTLSQSPGLGVCGSDIRQHVKLQGLPQQCNCGWLIDRLVEMKQVRIASHFHAPTLCVPRQGERLVAGKNACVWGSGCVGGGLVVLVCRLSGVQTFEPPGKCISLSLSFCT